MRHGIVRQLLFAGLTTLVTMSSFLIGGGSILLWKADRAIQRRMITRKILVSILEAQVAKEEFLVDDFSNLTLSRTIQSSSVKKHETLMATIEPLLKTLKEMSPYKDQVTLDDFSKELRQYRERFSQFVTDHGREKPIDWE